MPLNGESLQAPLDKPRSKAADKQQAKRAKDAAWQKVRKAVLVRDNYRCRVCGTPNRIEVHHLKPRSRGREDSTRNCLALCDIHHKERHAYRLFFVGDDANGRIRFQIMEQKRAIGGA